MHQKLFKHSMLSVLFFLHLVEKCKTPERRRTPRTPGRWRNRLTNCEGNYISKVNDITNKIRMVTGIQCGVSKHHYQNPWSVAFMWSPCLELRLFLSPARQSTLVTGWLVYKGLGDQRRNNGTLVTSTLVGKAILHN